MLQTTILRDKVKDFILMEMQKGALSVGKTINLAALSRKLGISVTPIREALSQLEESQIIKAVPNRGFVVAELQLKEAKDLYATVSQLEVMAIEDSHFTEKAIRDLKKSLLRLQQSHTHNARLQARYRFHDLLIGHCNNRILIQLLRKLKHRILFYEQAFIRDASVYENVDNQMEAIVQAIEEDNIPTAALILKMNWMIVLQYLEKRLSTVEKNT
ncbi:GntR family transcriptional regulator [Allomuricauda sp. SCSIO 65647]|uniref:GntR family transcriptional regulator n=1 Tax=Allomuricauda sp. SCSIO 65647 TaxID=2908843 RepID=UPI001F1C7103|nr:GntR family transcriptional regulator [Muricauda sp. SCSIO 65647]UJH67316.1 GntR family transcriptional regulator [Muricauda sp. SCSIO 65647]